MILNINKLRQAVVGLFLARGLVWPRAPAQLECVGLRTCFFSFVAESFNANNTNMCLDVLLVHNVTFLLVELKCSGLLLVANRRLVAKWLVGLSPCGGVWAHKMPADTFFFFPPQLFVDRARCPYWTGFTAFLLLFLAMAVDLLGSVAVGVEPEVVEGNSVIPVTDCGKNTGTWTSSRSLRKTSTSSMPTSPAGHRYVVDVI